MVYSHIFIQHQHTKGIFTLTLSFPINVHPSLFQDECPEYPQPIFITLHTCILQTAHFIMRMVLIAGSASIYSKNLQIFFAAGSNLQPKSWKPRWVFFSLEKYIKCSGLFSQNPIMVWFGRKLSLISFQPLCHGQGNISLDQVVQSPIQHFQGWGIYGMYVLLHCFVWECHNQKYSQQRKLRK